MSGNIKKYEVYENFFLVSVSGSSRGVDQMREQARLSMEQVRKRSEERREEAAKDASADEDESAAAG